MYKKVLQQNKTTNFKNGKTLEQLLHKRRYTNGKLYEKVLLINLQGIANLKQHQMSLHTCQNG